MAWTSDDLVSQVRLEGWLPDADDLSSANILSLADAELQSIVSGRLKVAREEHWVVTSDVSASAQRIRLPRRCLGRAVRGVSLVDAAGTESPFSLIDPSEAAMFGVASGTVVPDVGHFEDDELVFLATPASGYSIRFRYVRRPSQLVLASSCAAIQAPTSTTTFKLVAATPPATITTVAALWDVVRGDEPFSVLYEDRKTSAWSTPDITFATTPIVVAEVSPAGNPAPPGTRVDYACPRDQTCFPPLPTALFPVLVAATVLSIHTAQQNASRADLARARLAERIASARALMEPRTPKGAPMVRHGSPLRVGRFGGGSRRFPWR